MSAMVDELLDTMAFHGGQDIQLSLSELDIVEVIKEVQADAITVHGPRVRVDARSVQGWWDRDALKRVIENLVSNATKYGSPGTPVTIQSQEVHGRLIVTVHNEGPPIPQQEQECIFQMYRRAAAAQRGVKQGWGIGLPYVRAVTESHGGSIGLDSSIERGTTFVIDIPVDGRLYQNSNSLSQEQA